MQLTCILQFLQNKQQLITFLKLKLAFRHLWQFTSVLSNPSSSYSFTSSETSSLTTTTLSIIKSVSATSVVSSASLLNLQGMILITYWYSNCVYLRSGEAWTRDRSKRPRISFDMLLSQVRSLLWRWSRQGATFSLVVPNIGHLPLSAQTWHHWKPYSTAANKLVIK